MQSIKQIQRLNERELAAAVPSSASWHTDYRDTAYIYIGGLGTELSEGDVITIFSQCGDPVWIRLMRDKETGKSKGFAWLKYEDQRSCDLAVDNLGGASVMGRLLAVDHTRYKKGKDEDENEGYVGQDRLDDARSDPDSESEEDRPAIKEEIELQRLLHDHDDDDPMKAYMVESKREEVSRAKKEHTSHSEKDGRDRHRDRHRNRDRDRERRRRHAQDGRSRSPREHRRRRSESRDDRRRNRTHTDDRERHHHRRDREDGHTEMSDGRRHRRSGQSDDRLERRRDDRNG